MTKALRKEIEITNAYFDYPPPNTIKPPPFVPRPDLFDEIKWAPHVSPKDAKLAYRLWAAPNRRLAEQVNAMGPHPFPRPNTKEEENALDMDVLGSSVYEHLMHRHLLPLLENDRDVELEQTQWPLQDILNQDGEGDGPTRLLIQGYDVLTAPEWTVVKLQAELQRRGLPHAGKSAELRRRLYDHQRRQHNFLPRNDLSQWGITRANGYPFKLTENDKLTTLDMYTWATLLSPYNPTYWVSRAYCHYQQCFFDLAIGDAYRAQLLCEVLVNSLERNRKTGIYSRIWHAIEQHLLAFPRDQSGKLVREVQRLREPNGINYFIPTLRKALHNIISLGLVALQAWDDYDVMNEYLPQRVVMPYRDAKPFERRRHTLKQTVEELRKKKKNKELFFYERRAGSAPGARKYPYEAEDKARGDGVFMNNLNRALFEENQNLLWKKCAVRYDPVSFEKLGIFATQDIKAGAMIFAEEPSMRGHLSLNKLPKDHTQSDVLRPRCDHCHKHIALGVQFGYEKDKNMIKGGTHRAACKCVLRETRGVQLAYCPTNGDQPQSKTCSEIARELYHFRSCGKDWTWLHDAMRPKLTEWRDKYHFSHTNESHGTALSLLLREVFDITLMRRERSGDPNLMAHEIDELIILEDFNEWESYFPFTFAANIQVPFDILMQLGVDIFQDPTFDTWVIQVVLRKLLVNAVPWDERWRDEACHTEKFKNLPTPKAQQEMILKGEDFTKYNPSFQALYLFPGFSLFNHSCLTQNNAQWGYDKTVPNRVLVWATKDISNGEEIRIPYRPRPNISRASATRLLGWSCFCKGCNDRGFQTDSTLDDDYEEEEENGDVSNERASTESSNKCMPTSPVYSGYDTDGDDGGNTEPFTESNHSAEPASQKDRDQRLIMALKARAGIRVGPAETGEELAGANAGEHGSVRELKTEEGTEHVGEKRKRPSAWV